MRTVNNDILMEILLKSEIRQIPHWLRITKVSLAIAAVLEVAVVGTLVYGLLANAFTALSGTLFLLFLIAAATVAPVWLIKAHRRETEACRTATNLAHANRFRYDSIVNLYKAYTNSSRAYTKTEYCPECGFLLVPDSSFCVTCNTRLRR